MARDKALEALVNEELEGRRGLTQKAMFGGLAWMWNGHLVCAARTDGMLVRLGKGNDGWALAIDGVAPMVMGGRPMHGWVRASAEAYSNDAMRQRLVRAAMDFVRTLPAKD